MDPDRENPHGDDTACEQENCGTDHGDASSSQDK